MVRGESGLGWESASLWGRGGQGSPPAALGLVSSSSKCRRCTQWHWGRHCARSPQLDRGRTPLSSETQASPWKPRFVCHLGVTGRDEQRAGTTAARARAQVHESRALPVRCQPLWSPVRGKIPSDTSFLCARRSRGQHICANPHNRDKDLTRRKKVFAHYRS